MKTHAQDHTEYLAAFGTIDGWQIWKETHKNRRRARFLKLKTRRLKMLQQTNEYSELQPIVHLPEENEFLRDSKAELSSQNERADNNNNSRLECVCSNF